MRPYYYNSLQTSLAKYSILTPRSGLAVRGYVVYSEVWMASGYYRRENDPCTTRDKTYLMYTIFEAAHHTPPPPRYSSSHPPIRLGLRWWRWPTVPLVCERWRDEHARARVSRILDYICTTILYIDIVVARVCICIYLNIRSVLRINSDNDDDTPSAMPSSNKDQT